jgi:hypothetical protein
MSSILCVPSYEIIGTWVGDNMIFISNLVFYLTFIYLLYITYNYFAKLDSISNEYSEYKNNSYFKAILNYYKRVFIFVSLLVLISFIFHYWQIIGGYVISRDALHHMRLFKLTIALMVFVVNSFIKIINREELTLSYKLKTLTLFLPILLQFLMSYNINEIIVSILLIFEVTQLTWADVFILAGISIGFEKEASNIKAMVNNSR